MNLVLSKILETGFVQSPEGQQIKLHSHISAEQGRFLQDIIEEAKPTTTLEIGLAYGISALFICDALAGTPGGRHIIVDPAQLSDQYWKGAGLHNLKAAGYHDLIEFYDLPSHIALPQLELAGRQIDFAFIDGAHNFDYALVDFFCVDRLLRVGGVVVFDDLWMPSLQRLCRYVLTNRSYSVLRSFLGPFERNGQTSWKRKLLERAVSSSAAVKKAVRIEHAQPELDRRLGLPSQCVAFKKEATDERVWDFHRDF